MKHQITDIQVQKNHPARRSIFVDGQFFCGITDKIVNKLQLKCGMEVDEDNLKELIYEEEVSRAKNYVYNLLALRMYSGKEIRDKLNKYGYSDDVIQNVISAMEQHGYLNDKTFAEEWVQSRMHNRPKGKIVIQHELAKKGIEKSIIDEALSQELNETKEIDIALDLARRRIKSYNDDDPFAIRRKLNGFLIRRGFDFETVKNAVDQVMKEVDH